MWCAVFVMEMLEMGQGCTSFGIQIKGNPTDMSAMVHHSLIT
jgi:hypothetical protein